jgi:hypothetical protein
MPKRAPLNHKEVTIHITTDMFISCYKTVNEKTSSSPSGCHVGHYKAATKFEPLVALHTMMMSIPFKAGFAPSRWSNIIDTMLEKKVGCPEIHCL